MRFGIGIRLRIPIYVRADVRENQRQGREIHKQLIRLMKQGLSREEAVRSVCGLPLDGSPLYDHPR